MTEQLDSLVLEHLRHIRTKVDRIDAEIGDMKERLSNLEIGQGQILTQMGQVNARMDRVDRRISRIENRLDLVEAPNPAAG